MVIETTGHYLSDFLLGIVHRYRIESYMEIGVNEGRSLLNVVRNCPGLQRLVVADIWTGKHGGKNWGGHGHIARKLREMGYAGKVEFLDGDSKKTVPDWKMRNPGVRLGLITVDGDHDAVPAAEDLRNVADIGDIIVFDDIYHAGHRHLADVWDRFLEEEDERVKHSYVVKQGNGLGYVRFGEVELREDRCDG